MEEESRFDEEFRDSISTVDEQGKRIWVFPKKQLGKYFRLRAIVAYSLLAILFAGPYIRIGGEPLLMINVLERKFVLWGQIFWPQDIFIFAFGMIAALIGVILFTVVFGRLFCGWVCPQTVFMEMVFRRIEYWIDGDWQQQKKLHKMPWNRYKISRRLLKWAIFWIISFLVANTFLAYIIGSDELFQIMSDNPAQHVGGLIAIFVFTTVFFGVFTWFREQVCTAVCPYGRLQGVLMDQNSIVVGYDYQRGEGRAKFKKGEDRTAAGKGDCIDCKRCVHVCPTGIDIRNGTQMECVNCTICMDACNFMMEKVDLPTGLIRYDSEAGIKEKAPWKLTNRIKAYIVLMIAICGLLVTLILSRSEIDATILRVKGTTYSKIDEQTFTNIFEANILNKSMDDHMVHLKLIEGNGKIDLIGGSPTKLEAGSEINKELLITMKLDDIVGPKTPITVGIFSGDELIEEVDVNFNGPGF